MNEIVNKFLLARDKFMFETLNTACSIVLVDHLLKTNKIQKFKETEDSRYIYQNKLDMNMTWL